MRVRRRSDPQVRAFWSQHVAAWMRSPFSQREYAARHGISKALLVEVVARGPRAGEAARSPRAPPSAR